MKIKFNPIHCQKDYATGNITLQYFGIFDKTGAIEFIKKSYPDVVGLKILEHSVPYYHKGFLNVGIVTFEK